MKNIIRVVVAAIALTMVTQIERVMSQDWANWRGPEQNGIARDKNLPDDWSLESGKNVLWTSDIGGRATPIILNGRVYLNCRTPEDVNNAKEKIHSQERVVCWDAKSGDVLWEDRFNVFQTDIPAPRVGWASMCGDQETGNVFVHSVSGIFRCYTPEGKIVWEKSLWEDYGKISGYGGRNQTPIIDENRVIVSFLAANWGDTKGPGPLHYYYAFDKHDGKLLWVSAPGTAPQDTNYSVPIVQVIGGERMLIGGNGDGGIYAINARTGKPIWGFRMSMRGLNTSPVAEDDLVYIAHGEDNIDNPEFGRVQCIDGTGKGDITETHSKWRFDGVKAGYTALVLKDGILYVVADTGNLHAFDSKTGEELWVHNLGTVGKGSPVWADGKLYVMEVNGNVLILKPDRNGCETLSHVHLQAANGIGTDEIYASPAIADGRIFLVTRDRTICIGTGEAADPDPIPEMPKEADSGDEVDLVQIYPYEVVMRPGDTVDYEVHTFNKTGQSLGKVESTLTPEAGLSCLKMDSATATAGETDVNQAGAITTEVKGKSGKTRVRVFSNNPVWEWDFDKFKGTEVPPSWIRAFVKMKPEEIEGNMVMRMGPGKGRPSHQVSIGPSDMKDYTMQADVYFTEQNRRLANAGITCQRYNFIFKANNNKLSVQSWAPHLRMAKEINMTADTETWYRMKMKVDVVDGVAKVKGKIWKRDQEEPAEWTIEADDPHPNETGSPGLYVYGLADCFFDNVKVTQQEDK
jgi:outer membrane protein assembly factor BamB